MEHVQEREPEQTEHPDRVQGHPRVRAMDVHHVQQWIATGPRKRIGRPQPSKGAQSQQQRNHEAMGVEQPNHLPLAFG